MSMKSKANFTPIMNDKIRNYYFKIFRFLDEFYSFDRKWVEQCRMITLFMPTPPYYIIESREDFYGLVAEYLENNPK